MLYEYLLAIGFYAVFTVFAPLGLVLLKNRIPNFKIAYIASKPLGLLIFGYFIWFFASLGLLDFQKTVFINILLAALIVVSFWYLKKNWPDSWKTKKVFWWLLSTEAFWLIIYLAYLWIRSNNAAIHGTERFMDMAFFKASSMTHYFPPEDPWRAGNPINYYYYGHYLLSLFSNISGIAANFAYTFSLGLISSSVVMLSWAFVRNFSESKLFPALGAFFVALSGTAAYSFCVLTAAAGTVCSYAKSTRLYEPSYIINEIPSYSFTVGDLHAHLIALPFFVLALILLYTLCKNSDISWGFAGAISLVLASSGMINSWDFITLAMLIGFIAILKADKIFLFKMFAAGIFAVLLMLPFLLNFESGAAGIGFSPSFAKSRDLSYIQQYPTPIAGWLGMWGIFLLICLLGFIFRKKEDDNGNFPVLLSVGALALLLGVELFFVRDVYSLANPPYFRANTVFKFGFHTWILLALSSATFAAVSRKKILLGIVSISALALGSYYPYQAVNQFYLSEKTPLTLDGLQFLKTLYPADYETINWFRENVKERTPVIEAVGDSYTDYGRIAVFTGMPDPINWRTHEWTWHFKPEGEEPQDPKTPRESGWGKVAEIDLEVRKIYESKDPEETKLLLNKYGAKYVYIGELERKAYPAIFEEKFYKLGNIVFSSGNSKLFRLGY